MIYRTKGTCSTMIEVDLAQDHTINHVAFLGGCNGNLQGISRLVQGMKAEDVIAKTSGVRCGFKPTSCPDQLSIALKKALAEIG